MLTTTGIPVSVATAADAIRCDLIRRWRLQGQRDQILRFVQPPLIGLIDGTISTLAPIFAAPFLFAGSRAALLVGLAASLGGAISMKAAMHQGWMAALLRGQLRMDRVRRSHRSAGIFGRRSCDIVHRAPELGQSRPRQNFHLLLDGAGLPQRRFHDLRHSCATLLLVQGV